MALDMRALYYIALAALASTGAREGDYEKTRAIENCLNQNFTIIATKISELDARLDAIENALDSL